VLALFRTGHEFTAEQKRRDFEYYEPLTVRDSSLSAAVQAIIAAETGHVDLAYDYWGEAALMDLDDLEHNTADGLHIASLAGAWMVAVNGFGGLRDTEGKLSFEPRLPGALRSLTFNLLFQGAHLNVAVHPAEARYTCNSGDQYIDLEHYGEKVRVGPGGTQVRAIPVLKPRPQPRQPPGREPAQRSREPEPK
jgi:alpha,alpha-trehalose phosphorylase